MTKKEQLVEGLNAKKSPADHFKTPQQPEEAPAIIDKNPLKELLAEKPERKTRKVMLLLRPSLHDALKRLAKSADTSVNELVSTLLVRDLKQLGVAIEA